MEKRESYKGTKKGLAKMVCGESGGGAQSSKGGEKEGRNQER